MDRTAQGARALAILAVLLGLLAMHGLASTHHAAAATSAVQHATVQPDTAPVGTAPGHQHAVLPALAPDAVVTAAPAGPDCDEGCPDLAVLCIAVLTGVALLALLLAGRRCSPALPGSARRDAAPRAPPVRHALGPDSVKELCISRT